MPASKSVKKKPESAVSGKKIPAAAAGSANNTSLPSPACLTLTDLQRRQAVLKAIMNPSTYGGVKYSEVDPRAILVDDAYQRDPHLSRAHKIAEQWDPYKAQAVTCSYRNGELWAVNGQHTALGAQLAGVPTVAITILDGLSAQDEAVLFSTQDDNKCKVSSLAKYKADLFARIPYAVSLDNLLSSYGIRMDYSRTMPDGVCSATSCSELCEKMRSDKYGHDCLKWMLDVFDQAGWLMASNALVTKNVKSMGKVWLDGVAKSCLSDYTDRLVVFLNAMSPDTFHAYAHVCYPHKTSESRHSSDDMFSGVARGHVTLSDPVFNTMAARPSDG